MKNLLFLPLLLLGINLNIAQNQIILNVDLAEQQISRHIYGHFSEHLGRCIYGGFYVSENDNEKMLLTPTYHVLEMYKVHQDAKMIPIHVQSVDYKLGDKALKAVSASGSVNKDGKVHISLVNIHATQSQEVAISVRGMDTNTISGRILTADKLQAHNTFEAPNIVQPSTFDRVNLNGEEISLSIPAFSVVVLALN